MDDAEQPEDLDALRQDAARFRFLSGLTPGWTLVHKEDPSEHYVIIVSWKTAEKYVSLAQLVDAGMSESPPDATT